MMEAYPPVTTPWKNPDWESIKASPAIKGETERQIQDAREVMKERNDTSIDSPWWVHRSWSISDFYMIFVSVVWCPPMLLLWPILYIFCLLPVSLNLLYVNTKLGNDGVDFIPRDNWSWRLHCALQFVLSLPVQFLAFLILAYSHLVMTIFGMFYLVISSLVRMESPVTRLHQNLKVIAPHNGGPSLYSHFEDCVVAVAGSVYRQGLFEFNKSFANMFIINPWCKYWINGNIYLEDLGTRFLTQIGQSLKDIEINDFDRNARRIISRVKDTEENRKWIDKQKFAPYYPYPPPGRRYAIGMQFTGAVTTFCHATHFRSPETSEREGPIASLSSSCALPFYRVMLWQNNPYHPYTGYVEANLSTGFPSQPEKNLGAEHPMWLINSHNKLSADRQLPHSLGHVDTFFDEFIPHFNHLVRLDVLGQEAADAALAADPHKGYEATNGYQYQRMAEI